MYEGTSIETENIWPQKIVSGKKELIINFKVFLKPKPLIEILR